MSTSPSGGGKMAVWNFSSHSPAILTGSMSFGGEIPRLLKVGRAGTGAEAIVHCAGEHRWGDLIESTLCTYLQGKEDD